MDNLYKKGELLQVHTKHNEVVEGRFYGLNTDKTRLSLYNVKENQETEKSEGVCHYYNSEIRDIVKLKDTEDLALQVQKVLKITQKEVEDIIKTSKKYVYINQIDNTFHEAVEDLQQYNYIAVSTDGSSMGRKCKMPFLVMSTPQQIYIFDIQAMQFQAFDAGLKKILENNEQKKIVHDCRKLSDCLYHKHNVELKSVFDTQVADIIITKNKNGRLPAEVKSLKQCLNCYLGLPLNTIEEKLDLVQCNERPLSSQLKETLAKNIAYLHRLSEFINEEMMLPFVRGVECYVDNLRACDDFTAWDLCQKLNHPPKEFKNSVEY